jgi:CheY-like chemotaxis protein
MRMTSGPVVLPAQGDANGPADAQSTPAGRARPRILIVDDSPSIHEDFRKILVPDGAREGKGLRALEDEIFGAGDVGRPEGPVFEVDSASQGKEGVELVARGLGDGRPYALAFVDLRMPPGYTGVETISRMWELDPRLQIVMCTAYADQSWQQVVSTMGGMDRLVLLEKPFASLKIRNLVRELTTKWAQGIDPSGSGPAGQ